MNGINPQEESQWERLQKNKFSGSGSLGGAKQESQYKSSTEQERFARQLDRDLARKSKRLSQSTIRKLISEDTSQWAKSILDQKISQNFSTNASAQQAQPTSATTQTSDKENFISSQYPQNKANSSVDTVGQNYYIILPSSYSTSVASFEL